MKIKSIANNDEINIDQAAGEKDKFEIREQIINYKPVITKSTQIEMNITLNSKTQIFSRSRRLPFQETKIVDEQIEEWINNDIIEESNSEFTSPVVLVKKRDGSPRLCIDFRRINKVIVKDRFPLPLIEDKLDRLQDAKVFSTIDLKNGFFHVPVAETSKKCKDHGLELNIKKCHFLKRRIQSLGHIIKNQMLYPRTEQIEAVSKFNIPQTPKQLQGFLRLRGYFRKLYPTTQSLQSH